MSEILPVVYGKSVLPESMIFINGAKDKFRPIVFQVYLIKAENKLILVDAGCVTMPGFDMKEFIGPIKALEKLGISSDDITDLIITHAHHDHIECAKSFKNARIHIQKDEYERGKSYLEGVTNINLFDEEFEIATNIKVVKSGGHSIGSCIVEITENAEKYVIVGDECYLRECLENQIPTGSSEYPQKSLEFIKKYSDKAYHTLLCHDE